jgi:hypothetical protein
MTAFPRLALPALISLAAAACSPAERTETVEVEAPPAETRTVVETREVAVPSTVVVETPEVPPVVVERDRRGEDSTTVRAGRDGIEVETTNR